MRGILVGAVMATTVATATCANVPVPGGRGRGGGGALTLAYLADEINAAPTQRDRLELNRRRDGEAGQSQALDHDWAQQQRRERHPGLTDLDVDLWQTEGGGGGAGGKEKER